MLRSLAGSDVIVQNKVSIVPKHAIKDVLGLKSERGLFFHMQGFMDIAVEKYAEELTREELETFLGVKDLLKAYLPRDTKPK